MEFHGHNKKFVTIYKQCTCTHGECVCYQFCRYGI